MPDHSSLNISRRRLLELGGITVLGIVVEACARTIAPATNVQPAPTGIAPSTLEPAAVPVPTLEGVNSGKGAPAQTPAQTGQVMITPNADFYTVAYAAEKPDMPNQWNLTVGGNVDKPMTLSLDDIRAMPVSEEMRTLECISNPAGGPLISNAVWKGIKMKDLLERVGVKPSTIEIRLESFDGYSTAIPLDLAMHDHSLLAYEMNGEPLPIEHGKPLRCLWPGHYGMKQPKWLTKITAITDKYLGYWEQQGWSDNAGILPTSRIDVPAENKAVKAGSFEMKGIGFSGEEGIAKIEVSWDNGNTWHEATLVRGPTPYVWTNWSWSGPAPSGGEATLLARVTDNAGRTQKPEGPNLLGGTFPNGTSDMHAVVVNITTG
jgi:DMSO/TMAO reductase YedYZ molybdopterin-dependent catalytic subunit